MNDILFEGEVAKKTVIDGYYATMSGKIISVKVLGRNGLLNYFEPRELKYKTDKDGYLEVCLSTIIDGKHKRLYRRVHRLVWETFNGVIQNNLTIDHINRIKTDNNLSNLRLLTREENTSIAKKGTVPWQKGKPFKHRNIYRLYQNDVLVGEFDKKELISTFELSRYDVERFNKPTINKINKNIKLEKV